MNCNFTPKTTEILVGYHLHISPSIKNYWVGPSLISRIYGKLIAQYILCIYHQNFRGKFDEFY